MVFWFSLSLPFSQYQCGNYVFCVANSICSYDGSYPTRECVKGCVPKFPQHWNLSIWSNGCVTRINSNCKKGYTERFNIISGITWVLLYLHQDSRLRIIHRDLKASNILLGAIIFQRSSWGKHKSDGWNIVSFYLIMIFCYCCVNFWLFYYENFIASGNMSPEYIMRGHFSLKSDVFSYGVILL